MNNYNVNTPPSDISTSYQPPKLEQRNENKAVANEFPKLNNISAKSNIKTSDKSFVVKSFSQSIKDNGVKFALSACIGNKLINLGRKLENSSILGKISNKLFKSINKLATPQQAKKLADSGLKNIPAEATAKYKLIEKYILPQTFKQYPEIKENLLSQTLKKFAVSQKSQELLNNKNEKDLITDIAESFSKSPQLERLQKYTQLNKEFKNYQMPSLNNNFASKLKELTSNKNFNKLKGDLEISPKMLNRSFERYFFESDKNQSPEKLIENFHKDKKEELNLISSFYQPNELENLGEKIMLKAGEKSKISTPESKKETPLSSSINLEEKKQALEERKAATQKGINQTKLQQEKQKPEHTPTTDKQAFIIKDSDLGIEDED